MGIILGDDAAQSDAERFHAKRGNQIKQQPPIRFMSLGSLVFAMFLTVLKKIKI